MYVMFNQNKYKNIKTIVDGIAFDSKKEANRYIELKLLEKAKEITDLTIQPMFELQPSFRFRTGEKVQAIRYYADFSYKDKDGNLIIEDVKSEATKTPVYKLKRKLMMHLGYEIKEI